jgi:DNA repair exonuclease SbcCD ATPase subunit
MIHFKRIKWKNLLGTGDDFCEIELNKSPTTLINGFNGSGKSTLLDALTFVLFGDPFRNINLPQLVNDTNEAEMEVHIEFVIGKTNYKVKRGLKPRLFEIYINNKLVDQDSKARDYQKYLEQSILKLNKKSFTQVVVLGSASFVPFMQLTAAERRFIIEDLLDIQIFSAMNIALKAKVGGMKDEYVSLSNNIELQNEKILLVKSYLKKLKSDNVNAIIDKKNVVIENQEQIQETEKLISDNLRCITDFLTSITDHVLVKDSIRKFENIEDKLITNKSKIEKEQKFYEDNNECPTCKQDIDNKFKSSMIVNKSNAIKDIEQGLKKLETDLKKSENRLAEIAKVLKLIDKKNQENDEYNSSIRALNSYIDKIKSEIEELQDKNGDTKEQESKLKDLQGELDSLTLQRDEIISRKHYLDIVSVMLKDSGIKTKIIRQYLPIINKYVNKYLAAMDFFANFTIDENFREIIHVRGSKERTYYQLSEGQKLRIDLAILFCWRDIAKLKNSADTNLLIMDEIFESSLDATGVEDFLKLMQALSKNVNIFVISPQGDILVDKFSNTIKFVEEHGFSVMEK